jgi:molecular chaperone DnaK
MFKFLKGLMGTKAIGIDLGTTNSAMAELQGGKAKIIKNAEGKDITPSVVAFTESGEVLVGEPAVRQMVTNYKYTIYSIKRLMGKTYEETARFRAAFPYEVVEGEGGRACVKIHGKTYTPEQISAEILKKLKRDAEAELGYPIKEAVITVPAYFSDRQRKATINAGEIAGLNVIKVINEPTAATLVYGLEMKDDTKKVAVYDLGGGTYDFTVAEVKENEIKVLATGGNSGLGGDNFDEVLITKAVQKFMTDEGIDLTNGNPEALMRLKQACQQAKVDLSLSEKTEINLPYLVADEKGPHHFTMALTRQAFEKDISYLVDTTIEPIETVIAKSGLSKTDIDEVILVGGSTRIPLIQKKIESSFGKKPYFKQDIVDIAVASGAVIQAAIIKDKVDMELIDVVPMALGVETKGDTVSVIIEGNTPVPVSFTKKYKTAYDDMDSIDIIVTQGEAPQASKCEKLGEFSVVDIPVLPAGKVKVDVTFTIDENGSLTVSAVDDKGRTKTVVVESVALRQDEKQSAIKEASLPEKKRQALLQGRADLNKAIEEAQSPEILALPQGDARKDLMAVLIKEGEDVIEGTIVSEELTAKAKKIEEVKRAIEEDKSADDIKLLSGKK